MVAVLSDSNKEQINSYFVTIKKSIIESGENNYTNRALSLVDYIEKEYINLKDSKVADLYFNVADNLFSALYLNSDKIRTHELITDANSIQEKLEKVLSREKWNYLYRLHKLVNHHIVLEVVDYMLKDMFCEPQEIPEEDKNIMKEVLSKECFIE